MATSHPFAPVALFTCLAAACDSDETQSRVYEDTGMLCLLPEGERVRIYSLSGSCDCDEVVRSTCKLALEGDRIVVSSETVILTPTRADIVCPADCRTKSALCYGDVPAVGQYTLVYGSEQASVTFPLDAPLQPFGTRPSSDCDSLAETRMTQSTSELDAGLAP